VSAGDTEAAEAIRDLVETVTVFRDPARPGGVAVEIALNALLGEEPYPNRVKGVRVLSDGSGGGTPYQSAKFGCQFNELGRPERACVLCW